VVFLNWSFNSRHVILIFPFILHGPHLVCLLSSTSASICKPQLAQYLDYTNYHTAPRLPVFYLRPVFQKQFFSEHADAIFPPLRLNGLAAPDPVGFWTTRWAVSLRSFGAHKTALSRPVYNLNISSCGTDWGLA
jgi:hypothetical protein